MKEHPDGQPCGAKPVNGSDDYDANGDEQFERKGIYGATSALLYTKKDAKRC
jgi:hypothetical protein